MRDLPSHPGEYSQYCEGTFSVVEGSVEDVFEVMGKSVGTTREKNEWKLRKCSDKVDELEALAENRQNLYSQPLRSRSPLAPINWVK